LTVTYGNPDPEKVAQIGASMIRTIGTQDWRVTNIYVLNRSLFVYSRPTDDPTRDVLVEMFDLDFNPHNPAAQERAQQRLREAEAAIRQMQGK
jgi:hypothetical protein